MHPGRPVAGLRHATEFVQASDIGLVRGTVKTLFTAAALAIAAVSTLAATNVEEPLWAYGFNGPPSTGPSSAPPPAARPDSTTLLHVEGSKQSLTRAQVIDYYGPADWFPEDHPPM